jgi:hypothetical protein
MCYSTVLTAWPWAAHHWCQLCLRLRQYNSRDVLITPCLCSSRSLTSLLVVCIREQQIVGDLYYLKQLVCTVFSHRSSVTAGSSANGNTEDWKGLNTLSEELHITRPVVTHSCTKLWTLQSTEFFRQYRMQHSNQGRPNIGILGTDDAGKCLLSH